ncbi:TPA: hypothetical protein HA235_00475 [Candidatus Woesearchaeota archaeon]|nr:hypothetical protein [Candidatus Woesearchaeota archaeon]HIH31159.1 hypothetical protein [Candidatus Woesearchaeota archaeon]HIH54640.1 hypothetical protein [Candidatus Woesearchaeota archaeon]HIJ02307.1 hypothetical protein [Candidatus Woesearchaeota archaeon]HIJ14216.1 hypothetical protein [Candidatus Woesearchaeota archaeon]
MKRKTLSNTEKVIDIDIPNNLIKGDQPACQINALNVVFHNLGYDLDIERIKVIFNYDESDGAENERHNFQKFNNELQKIGVPYRTNKIGYSDIHDTFVQFSDGKNGSCVPVFFEMSILKIIAPALKDVYEFNIGNNIYKEDKKHILLLIGYKKGGETLLFVDPLYQLPYANKEPIKISYLDVSQHSRHIKSYIKIILDTYRLKDMKNKGQTKIENS